MKEPFFTGACTALVTPFLDNQVNYPMLEQLLRRQLDAGIEAIVICGTTGEAPTLSDSEKLELFSRAKHYTGGACKIIAGTGSNATVHAVRLSIAAQQCGADGLLVVTPYYNKANPQGLYTHYALIASSVNIPLIVYNVPSRTGIDIPISVYRELSAIYNINGIKEAGSDISKQVKTLAECGEEMNIWAGNDDQIVPSIALGGKGVISVVSNIYPAETNIMVQAALAGDFKTAAAYQHRFSELLSLLFADINPIPVKYAMSKVGFDCGNCRLPLTVPTTSLKEQLDAYFK